MGGVNIDLKPASPGWVEVWKLYRHCCCRFGWYPLLLAPLVTCACLLDLYSSTGCDFIRMDIGFVPANGVWEDSRAQLGLFSFDSHEDDANKWKRSFNNGCQAYSPAFENTFIKEDQTWHTSRIFAYMSGISSLVALATAWLLTVTPLPVAFFWPGVLLPACLLAMCAGAAKFLFFNAELCTDPLWFAGNSTEPVAAQSCDIGESSVFGIASVCAFFFCCVLICFRSPQKRPLDESFGRKPNAERDSEGTMNTIGLCNTGTDLENQVQSPNNTVLAVAGATGLEQQEIHRLESERTRMIKNNTPESFAPQASLHARSTSDVTWSGSHATKDLGVLSPPERTPPEEKRMDPSAGVEWNEYGRPIVVTINDSVPPRNRLYSQDKSLSYSDGSTTQSSSKSPGRGTPTRPPRHNGKSSLHPTANSTDASSVNSRISKLSFTDTQASDEMSALGMHSYSAGSSAKSTPSIVNVPRRSRHTVGSASPGSSKSSSGKKLRYAKRGREDRNDVFLDNPTRVDASKREGAFDFLPAVDEMSASSSRSLEDHGELINKCVRDLQLSFQDGGGFNTM
ncbi:hypothetical protein ACHAXT_007129 [Thalassiosira profunda]